jgi:hypothetical protein
MRFFGRKRLSWVLLALYGSVGVLGYGLHELSAVDHHHHGQVAHAGHQHHHHCGHGPCSGHDRGPADAGIGSVHDCQVCEFLDQIRSERPAVVTGIVWQQLVAAVSVTAPRFSSEPILGLHVPRGPPTLVG